MSEWMRLAEEGPVAYWSFNDAGQDVVDFKCKDNSGNGHDAVGSELIPSAAGPAGPAADLNGSSAYFTVSHHADFDFSGDFSIAAEVSFDTAPGSLELLVEKYGGTVAGAILLGRYANGKARFFIRKPVDPAWDEIFSDSAISNDGWHFIVAVRSSGTMYLWVDGVQQADTAPNSVNCNGTQDIDIGHRSGSGSYRFDGGIQHVRIYDRALAAWEVKYLYENPTGNIPEMLLSYRIAAQSILAEHLSVVAQDLVNNISQSKHLGGWGLHDEQGRDVSGTSRISIVDGTYDGETVKAMRIDSDTNWTVRSKTWRVNHNEIYKCSIVAVRTAGTVAELYFGPAGFTSTQEGTESTGNGEGTETLEVWTALTGSRIKTGEGTNKYFVLAKEPGTTTTYTSYIVGANRDVDECPNVENCTNIIKLKPSTTHVALRIPRWQSDAGATYDIFFPYAQRLGAGTIVTENLLAESITSSLMKSTDIYTLTMESTNYIAGELGWKIDRSGSAEFQDVEVRGDVYSEKGFNAGAAFYFTRDQFMPGFYE
jgi:hypothetical protein